MYCRKCGKEIKDGSTFCSFCGEPVAQSASEKDTSKYQQAGYNARQDIRSDYNSYNDKTANPTPTMKWYNFLVYAGQFFYAFYLLFFFFSILFLQYMEDASIALNMEVNTALYRINVAFAIFAMVMAYRAIMIRQDLKYYKKNAGKSYIRDTMIFMIVATIDFAISSIIEDGFSFIDILVAVLFFVLIGVFIYCNTNYFKNREYLFQN